MTVLPTLRANVRAAAIRRARAATPAAPYRRRGRWRVPLIALAIVAATGSALAASGVWNPQVGDSRRGHPTVSGSSVPADQLAHFGVLRRDATDADHGAQVRYALRYLDARSFRGVRTDGVRLLSTTGSGYVLIPAEHASLGEPTDDDDALCLFAIDEKDGGGLSCWTTAQILAGKAVLLDVTPIPLTSEERAAVEKAAKAAHGSAFSVPGVTVRHGAEAIAGLVPDGVTTVEVVNGRDTVRASVTDNFFVAPVPPGDAQPSTGSPVVRWLDSHGKDVSPQR